MNFGDIDLADNAFVGGILGFVEEAMKNERFGKDGDVKLAVGDIREEDLENDCFKLLYNQNPNLAVYLVNKFVQHKKIAPVNQMFRVIMAEIDEEIKHMKREEKDGNRNDK